MVLPAPEKGKGKFNPDPPKTRISANKETNTPKGHIEKEAPILLTTASGKRKIIEQGYTEKAQPTFNLQKEL